MNISENIIRIKNAKSAIKTSIKNKGVEVPETTTLDGYASLVDQIQAGGSDKLEQSKSVIPSIHAQTILPDEGYILSSVEVSEVDSSIDANITPANIKKNVNILGVTGTLEDLTTAIIEGSITELVSDDITIIGSNGMREKNKLVKLHLPNLKTIGGAAMMNCGALSDIYFPNVTSIGSGSFSGCYSITEFYLPRVTVISNCFSSCTSLAKADFSELKNINGTNTFAEDSNLTTLILRSPTICVLQSVNTFKNTPFRNGIGGNVYVPENLVESYKIATNWSSLESTTFLPIEGSEYE